MIRTISGSKIRPNYKKIRTTELELINKDLEKKENTMPRNALVIVILGVAISGITISSIFVSAEEGLLPSWIKNTAGFWADDQISDKEFINALQYLVEQSILVIPDTTQTIVSIQETKAERLRLETDSKLSELNELGNDLQIQQFLIDSNQEFANIDNVSLLIDERNNDWTSVDKDEVTRSEERRVGKRV